MLCETMTEIVSAEAWSNKDNQAIYEQMPIAHFKKLAEKIGFAQGEDLEHIYEYIVNATSILDVGGGYSRVISKVAEINAKAAITAVERNHKLAN